MKFFKKFKRSSLFAILLILKDYKDWIDFFKWICASASKTISHMQSLPEVLQESWFKIAVDILLIWLFYSLEKSVNKTIRDQKLSIKALTIKAELAGAVFAVTPYEAFIRKVEEIFTPEEIEILKELGIIPHYYTRKK